MAFRLFRVKPFMYIFCGMDRAWEQASVVFEPKYNGFHPRKCGAKCRLLASWIIINIGSGIDLLPDGTRPFITLTNFDSSSLRSDDIHLEIIQRETVTILIRRRYISCVAK